jgi:dipeptidyl aminopeptidase/acylaminoacyl peptidase
LIFMFRALLFMLALVPLLSAQEPLEAKMKHLETQVAELRSELDQARKIAEDTQLFLRVSDVAEADKVILTGPPNPKGPETYGIRNERHPLRIYAYTFVPRQLDRKTRHPAVLLIHGGVHGDFGTYHLHLVRELVAHGYIVIAPDYRGSTGYGQGMQDAIDYGGLENEDVVACRDWAVEELPVDPARIALVGWSHGGMISLMAGFDHPDKFACIYAGVPVSDLLARVGYAGEEYRDPVVVKGMFGKEPTEDVDLLKRRSPCWNVEKLKIPLMVTSTTNDRDVDVVEVQQLITHLKAAGKTFEYRVEEDAPGGHGWDRIDTSYARKSRKAMYAFLAKHLGK